MDAIAIVSTLHKDPEKHTAFRVKVPIDHGPPVFRCVSPCSKERLIHLSFEIANIKLAPRIGWNASARADPFSATVPESMLLPLNCPAPLLIGPFMPLISFDGINQPLEEVQNNPARFALNLERAKKSPG